MNVKAVSEILGGVLVLMIILVTIGIIFSTAFPTIDGLRKDIRLRGIQSHMLDFKELVERSLVGVEPYIMLKFPIAGGSLYLDNSTKIVVRVWNSTSSSWDEIINESIGRFEYSEVGWYFVYENGALIENKGYSRMVTSPKVYTENESGYAYLSYPIISFQGNLSVGGSGMPIIKIRLVNVTAYDFNNTNVSITLETKDAQSWKNFFDYINANATLSGNRVTLQDYFNETHITVYRIEVSL
ncbi:hypothetical protein DRP05_02910 [Archaeoglobales archaeon]|nr:MAG: hypothetical protein DRP05_02910 [Archaeoglobales archaeon]